MKDYNYMKNVTRTSTFRANVAWEQFANKIGHEWNFDMHIAVVCADLKALRHEVSSVWPSSKFLIYTFQAVVIHSYRGNNNEFLRQFVQDWNTEMSQGRLSLIFFSDRLQPSLRQWQPT